MDNENTNWLHDLFISEAKAAKDYHNRGGGEEIPTQEKTIDITENGTVVVEPDEGHTMSKVTANVDIPETPTQEKTIDVTENGTVVIKPDAGYALSKATATVNVPKDGVDKIQRLIELNNGSAKHFFSYLNVTSVDELLDGVDTSDVTDMSYMFSNNNALTSVPLFDTSNVTNMTNMFNGCSKLTTVPLFNTSNVKNMSNMFSGCYALASVPLFDTSNVTDMSYMFSNNNALASVPLFDTSNVKNMNYMFNGCTALAIVSLFDTSKVTSMANMFRSCSNLTSAQFADTSKVTSMANMFQSCSNLTSVQFTDTRKVDSLKNMFASCAKLTTILGLDMRSYITNGATQNWLVGCSALTECKLYNIRNYIQVSDGASYGNLLTLESLLHLCKECIYNGVAYSLTMGSANLEKLANVYVKLIPITDEMRAEDDLIDKKYPFVQCESTDEGAMLVEDYMAMKLWQLA